MESLTFTIDQLCHAVNLSRATIYAEIKSGRLKTIKLGKRRLIRRQDADAWLEKLLKKGSL
jgi:excisionase family DNA binding protein